MTLKEKSEFVRLLRIYQEEQLENVINNINKVKELRKVGKDKYDTFDLHFGCKAQYEHARIIANKISKEIEKEMPSYWQL